MQKDAQKALGDSEYRFACIVWEQEPIASGLLVQQAAERFGWKKSTSYTVLKNLIEKGILQNEGRTVTAKVKKAQVQRGESEAFLQRTFAGSLPAFCASVLGETAISAQEADAIRALLDASVQKQSESTQ